MVQSVWSFRCTWAAAFYTYQVFITYLISVRIYFGKEINISLVPCSSTHHQLTILPPLDSCVSFPEQ